MTDVSFMNKYDCHYPKIMAAERIRLRNSGIYGRIGVINVCLLYNNVLYFKHFLRISKQASLLFGLSKILRWQKITKMQQRISGGLPLSTLLFLKGSREKSGKRLGSPAHKGREPNMGRPCSSSRGMCARLLVRPVSFCHPFATPITTAVILHACYFGTLPRHHCFSIVRSCSSRPVRPGSKPWSRSPRSPADRPKRIQRTVMVVGNGVVIHYG